MRLLFFLSIILTPIFSWCQVSLTTVGSAYTQNFNSLANTGTSSTLPTGWNLSETGTAPNTSYTAGTGSGNTGDTYSFGATGNSDRALGGLQSGAVNPIVGASFTNNTGATLTSLDIAYVGEQWRLGATGRVDRIDFQYSLNATSLTTGTWTDFNTLDFTAPITSGTIGLLDGDLSANRTSISSSITGLSISNTATFWIRWTDLNASGSDDGLGIDDFSLTPIGVVGPELQLEYPVTTDQNCGFAIDFGSQLVGATAYEAFYIVNNGTADLNVTDLVLSNTTDFELIYGSPNLPPPFTLSPGASMEVIVAFTGTFANTFNETVTILNDDSNEGSCIVNLSAVAVDPSPEIQLQYPLTTNQNCGFAIDFGSQLVGSTAYEAFYIVNNGTADLNVTDFALSNTTDFVLIYGGPNLPPPFTLSPGASMEVIVAFTGTIANTFNETVTILNDDANEGSCIVNLSAIAVDPSPEIQLQYPLTTNQNCGFTLDFGSQLVGATAYEAFFIVNNGTADLNVTDLVLSNSTDFEFIYGGPNLPPPFTLSPGASMEVIVAFTGTFANTFNETVTIVNDDANESGCIVNLTAISVDPTPNISLEYPFGTAQNCGYTYAFGNLISGTTIYDEIRIVNNGIADLIISDFVLSNSIDFSILFMGPSIPPPITIPVGSFYDLIIGYTASVGSFTGTITIVSNDPDGNCVVNLTGSGYVPSPEIQLQHPVSTLISCGFSHNFGTLATGSSGTTIVRISNTGTSDLVITSFNMSNADFSISSSPILPATIGIGTYLDIIISFIPSVSGNSSGTLTILSNDTDQNNCLINLNGRGIETCAELFISEYIEGSSNNKYLEIYNPSTNSILLSDYRIRIYNGGATTPNSTILLTGTLAPYSTYVLANSSATAWTGTANQLSGSVNFTGDDAVELFNTSLGYTADIIGKIGEDPGTSWTAVGGYSTGEKTIVRNSSITRGILVNPSSGFPTLASDWTVYNQDVVSNLGIHVSNCINLTVTSISSPSFSVGCISGTNGSLTFTSSGNFASGNTFTIQLSNASGSFSSPVNIGVLAGALAEGINPSGTINFIVPASTATGNAYRLRIVASNPYFISLPNSSDISVTFNSDCTLLTTSVSSNTFEVNCTSAAIGTVSFSFTGTINANNIYTAQLSNSASSFVTPTNIGTLNSTSLIGTINISIPFGTLAGTGYRIRVISSSPNYTGTNNGSDITISIIPCPPTNLSDPGLIINEWSNGPDNEKEYYEFVVAGQCGDLVDIRNYILDDNNGTFTSPSSYSGTSSGIAPGHFKFSNVAQWANIPVGSLIVIYNNNDRNPSIPADDPSDSNNDSLYVIPHTSSLFQRCGTFPDVNSPDSIYIPCTYATAILTGWGALSLRNAGDAIQVRNPNGSYYFGVSYGGSEMSGGPHNTKQFIGSGTEMCGWFNSGDFTNSANWSAGTISGNETPGLPNNAQNLAWLRMMRNPFSIVCPIVILPTTTVEFKGHYDNDQTILYWQTSSEQNNDYFTLHHSINGYDFINIGTIKGSGNTNEKVDYQFIHERPENGINYYKLTSTDYDGTTYNKGIVSVMVESEGSYFDNLTSSLKFNTVSDFRIFSSDGKLLGSVENSGQMHFDLHGLILIQDVRSGIIERLFIPQIK